MKFFFDPTTRITPGRIIGGSPPSILRLSRRGEETITRIITGDDLAITPLIRRMLDLNQIHPRFDPHRNELSGKVTVITPALGERIHRHPSGEDVRVVVVDDGSQPPLVDATLRLEANSGPAAARNAGLQVVDTEFVAFVDADVDVGPDATWLHSLLPHFDDPNVAAVAPRIRHHRRNGMMSRHESANGALDLGPLPASVRPGTRVSYVPSAALLCRTADIADVSGFDPLLRTGEDVDLIWRLHANGKTVRYDPSVVVHHEPRTSFASWWEQRVGYGRSSAALAMRHGNVRVAPLVTSPWSIAALLFLIVPRRRLLGIAGFVGATCAAVQRLRRRVPDLSVNDASNIVLNGTQHTAVAGARAVRRVWWPMLLVLSPFSRSSRRVVVLSFLAARTPMAALDDVAHGVGIWSGSLSARVFGAVLPRIHVGRPQQTQRAS